MGSVRLSGRAACCPDKRRRQDEREHCTSQSGTARYRQRQHRQSYESSPSSKSPHLRACAQVRLIRSCRGPERGEVRIQFEPGFAQPLKVRLRAIVRQLAIACKAKIAAMPAHLFCRRYSPQATDSRSHLPMSAEPFLVPGYARVSKSPCSADQNTHCFTCRNFVFAPDRTRAARMVHAARTNFLPLRNQRVDESCGITGEGWLR